MKTLSVIFALGLSLGLTVPATAAPTGRQAVENHFAASQEPVRKQLLGVVKGQLAAFKSGDMARAYTFASSEIHRQFAPDEFARMVRGSYPDIASPGAVQFGPVFDDGKRAVVHVTITGTGDKRQTYTYLLHKEKNNWKIGGVYAPEPAPVEGELRT